MGLQAPSTVKPLRSSPSFFFMVAFMSISVMMPKPSVASAALVAATTSSKLCLLDTCALMPYSGSPNSMFTWLLAASCDMAAAACIAKGGGGVLVRIGAGVAAGLQGQLLLTGWGDGATRLSCSGQRTLATGQWQGQGRRQAGGVQVQVG